MTILPNCPKKKSPQNSVSGEIELGDGASNANHNSCHSSHHQLPNIATHPNNLQVNADNSPRSNLYLSPQSTSPWSSSSSGSSGDEIRSAHSSPQHYEESHESSAITTRRYRKSPLRNVRPKLREHRGKGSPPYPSTSNNNWNHNHQLQVGSPSPASIPNVISSQAGPSSSHAADSDDDHTGYNSGDEYAPFDGWDLTKEQWDEKERWFEKKMKKKNLIIKQMQEDGACLFRAIADQVYGDQDFHAEVRKHCMNYVQRNRDAFQPFVSESFMTYVDRKRQNDCFGNHIEIAAMSEMYNRMIEVYCYSTEPINIFQGNLQTDNAPIKLSYHKGTHYNSLVDPYKATIGVGLGLPNLQPGLAEKNLMTEATQQSEMVHLEQTMLEDKIRATDFEATSEAMEEQIVQQSYLDWLCNQHASGSGKSCSPRERCSSHQNSSEAGTSLSSCTTRETLLHTSRGSSSPNNSTSTKRSPHAGGNSPPYRDIAIAGSSKDPIPSSPTEKYDGTRLDEKASFLNHLPPDVFGLTDYTNQEASILAKVLATSHQEYLDTLKSYKKDPSSPSTSSKSNS